MTSYYPNIICENRIFNKKGAARSAAPFLFMDYK